MSASPVETTQVLVHTLLKTREPQERPSEAKARIDFARLTARVELVPFPFTRESAVFQIGGLTP